MCKSDAILLPARPHNHTLAPSPHAAWCNPRPKMNEEEPARPNPLLLGFVRDTSREDTGPFLAAARGAHPISPPRRGVRTEAGASLVNRAANEARSLSDMRRVALASAALAFCLPAQWVGGASAAVACLTAATGRRLGASARLGVAIVASATRLDSTLSQELPHALARVMAHATRLNARLASRKCDRPRSRQSTAC